MDDCKGLMFSTEYGMPVYDMLFNAQVVSDALQECLPKDVVDCRVKSIKTVTDVEIRSRTSKGILYCVKYNDDSTEIKLFKEHSRRRCKMFLKRYRGCIFIDINVLPIQPVETISIEFSNKGEVSEYT